MSSLPHEWWVARRDDLLSILCEKCPVAVYDGETINDIIFDLLSIESVDKLFYPLAANPQPEILERAFTLGAGFTCISAPEVRRVLNALRQCRGHQVLFVPGAGYAGDWDYPLETGVLLVFNHLTPLNFAPDLLRGKRVLAYADISGQGSTKQNSISRMTGLQDRLKNFGARLKGFYVPGEIHLSDLEEWLRNFPECEALCLGKGGGISLDSETGCLDVPKTTEKLEEVKAARPDLELWVELDARAMACTGALLTRVKATWEVDDALFLCLEMNGQGTAFSKLPLGCSRILNLSGEPGRGVPWEMVRISGYEHGNPVCMAPDDFPVNQGDPLLMTPMGLEGDCRDLFPEHYLRARRICQVPI